MQERHTNFVSFSPQHVWFLLLSDHLIPGSGYSSIHPSWGSGQAKSCCAKQGLDISKNRNIIALVIDLYHFHYLSVHKTQDWKDTVGEFRFTFLHPRIDKYNEGNCSHRKNHAKFSYENQKSQYSRGFVPKKVSQNCTFWAVLGNFLPIFALLLHTKCNCLSIHRISEADSSESRL